MKNKILILGVIICVGFLQVGGWAQQFKWVHGGGTIYDFSSAGSSSWEQTKFVCTDPDGNIYVVSQVGDDPVVADTFHANPYGDNQNIVLTSYGCDGQMRWAKLIASSGGTCTPFGLIADSLGHIYLSGAFVGAGGGSTFYIGQDTAISSSATTHLATGLIQFDTSGHFKWIRYVGPNTFAGEIAIAGGPDPITIDGANNAHYFVYVSATGIPLTSSVTSVYGVYDIAYDPLGALLSATRLDLDSQWFLHGVVIDPATNKLYIYGEVNQSSGATDTFFAAAFDASRNKLWQYFAGYGDDDGFTGIVLDKNKSLYFSGTAQPRSGETRFVFNGDSVLAPYDDLAIIIKMDTNANVKWIRSNGSHVAVDYLGGIALLPNNKVAAVGTFAGTLYYGLDTSNYYYNIDSLTTPPGDGYSPYLAIFDSAGYLHIIQQMFGDGFYNSGDVITADRVGNIYVGGKVVDSIWAGSPAIPAYHSIGGNTDFFVMKYGVDCSCTTMPTAFYTDTGTTTVGFSYTGTSTGIDSVRWDFGDGSTSTSTNPIHTYTASGVYTSCVTVYSDCGNDMYCKEITVSICSVTPTASFSDTGTHTIGFTYTGTTTGLDSVVWNFGDGTTSTGTSPLHTYTAAGTYTVCVTAYTACGSDSACHTVVVSPTGIATLSLENVQVYPNPVSDELHIVGVPEGASYRLLIVTGVAIQQGMLDQGRNILSMKGFAPGVYILEMTSADGLRNMARVVKE